MTDAIHVVGAAIVQGATCLAAQRSASMSNPLKWEFPGGKLEPGESPEQALVREIHEELGLWVEVGIFLARGHGFTQKGRAVVLDVYMAKVVGGDLVPTEHAVVDWYGCDVLRGLGWGDADRPALRHVLALLEGVT